MEGGDWKWQGGDPPVHQLGRTVPAAGVDPLSLSPCRTAQIWVLFTSLEIRDVIQKWLITFEESYSKPKAGHLKRWHSCPGCPSSAEHRVPGCELRVPPSLGPGPCLGGWRAALASGLPGQSPGNSGPGPGLVWIPRMCPRLESGGCRHTPASRDRSDVLRTFPVELLRFCRSAWTDSVRRSFRGTSEPWKKGPKPCSKAF